MPSAKALFGRSVMVGKRVQLDDETWQAIKHFAPIERDIDQFLLIGRWCHVPVTSTQLKWWNGAPPSAFAA